MEGLTLIAWMGLLSCSHTNTRDLLNADFRDLLAARKIYLHTLVYGELLLGDISESLEIKNLLQMIPRPKEASFTEVNTFIESRGLHKKKIGWVDSALLASALLTQCRILTEDMALRRASESILE
jgi:hypothetical protein